MTRHLKNYIHGEFVAARSGRFLDVMEPAIGAVYCQIPDSDANDVAAAVDAAKHAFNGWAHTPSAERSRLLLRVADLIEANLERLACAESIDTGKPIALARTVDIPRAVANFRFFATAILHAESESHSTDYQALNYTLRRPCGVAGLISPWNLPLYLLSWKIAPAIAVGNTAVAKPSEVTPMTAYLLCELLQEASLPPGVVNIVHGRGTSAGAALVAHRDVPLISFTGGTVTGAEIARTAGPMFKRLSLELGGKNPTLVFADADLDRAVAGSVRAAFSNQGQVCLCGSRILVERSIFKTFVDRFVAAVRALKIGDPLEEATQQGALVSQAHLDKVRRYVTLAIEEGGRILCGGKEPAPINDRCRNGYFYEPTVIVDLPVRCRVNMEEIFGPVVTVAPFTTEADAIDAANAVEYGLSASLWTGSLTRAHRLADAIDAGTVWVNCWLLRDLRVPFGGMKASGIGREGGTEALRFFTEAKNVCIHLD